MGREVDQVHEAAHGWFGDGVRLRCWEDFVLSEGTASHLDARGDRPVSK
jgi:aminopeptidase N